MKIGEALDSTANPTIRRIASLRDNRRRRRAGVVITDGLRTTQQAIQAGWRGQGVFVSKGKIDGLIADGALSDIEELTPVGESAMRKIRFGENDADVIGLFEYRTPSIAEIQFPTQGLVIVADQIEKPGNLGAIYRSAAAAGANAVLISDGGDPSHPNAIRNSQGAVFSIPTCQTSMAAANDRLVEAGYSILAARVEGAISIDKVPMTGPTAIVVGNEANGLKDRWADGDRVQSVMIPMLGSVDSLNVSVSASIFLMEAARQRRQDD